MRSTRILSLVACLGIAACSSTAPGPSLEVTSSVLKSKADTSVTDIIQRVEPQAELTAVTEVVSAEVVTEEAVPVEVVALAPRSKPTAAAKAFGDGIVHPRRFRDAKPINFGKASPRQMAVHGVDVSRWQGNIDWVKLRGQGANFAYIKATDGGDHLDPMFRKNWRAAHEAGLKRGAYHFFYWCRTGAEQAEWFIRNVPKVEGALPPVIDVEWNGESNCKRRPSPEKVREKMKAFMDRLEAHYGQRPIIYTAPDFYRDNLRGAFEGYPFWLRAVAQHPSKVYPGRKWLFWQYSGSGLSHGVKGKIDLNVFNGNEAQWRAWSGMDAVVASAD